MSGGGGALRAAGCKANLFSAEYPANPHHHHETLVFVISSVRAGHRSRRAVPLRRRAAMRLQEYDARDAYIHTYVNTREAHARRECLSLRYATISCVYMRECRVCYECW